MLKRAIALTGILIIALSMIPTLSFADDDPNEQVFYIGEPVNAGLDTGYEGSSSFGRDDLHFGWDLGRFTVSGYTSVKEDADGTPVFLKTPGDEVKLSFRLEQNINALDGNESLAINGDIDGYDVHFGIDKTDFGKGALIIRQTNYQNETGSPQVYTNYLSGVEQGADTEVELFEEGDYEVRLDYELKNDERKVGPVSILPGYANYKIDFKFKVRNGNCMVFPFDLATKMELANEAYAPNGFYLDLARSRYLDINVKKEVMAAGANGLVEDARFNGPARDGDQYTQEGIYTITVSNPYTGQETIKKIYVGDDPVLKACAVTGLSVEEIGGRLANGEVIAESGQLVAPEAAEEVIADEEGKGALVAILAILLVSCALATALVIAKKRRRFEAAEGPKLLNAENTPLSLPDGEEKAQ
ncbi:hypothetical protein [uncultured Adlercreutzia sp.]|uniref:hypothetical protein n=1 Tax=uncultured Adlercreutzia sp. TaxID=875803 RepID=UPI0026F3CB57|nr:hypothetical protein [uncultured Adlercreutzia sp.]